MCIFPRIQEPDPQALLPAKSPPPAVTPDALFRPGEGAAGRAGQSGVGTVFRSLLERLRLPTVPGQPSLPGMSTPQPGPTPFSPSQ